MWRLVIPSAVAILLTASTAGAQKSMVTNMGWMVRYHGDTIWVERDSVASRAIVHGDTVDRVEKVNDRHRSDMSYRVRGDSAFLLIVRDSSGRSVDFGKAARAVPALVVLFERQILGMQLRTADLQSRVPFLMVDRFDPPAHPDSMQTYAVSRGVTMSQRRDTVWYVNGCAALGRADTTVFLLFARDSVKRLSPNPRMFGQAMALSLVGHMRTTLLQASVAARSAAATRDVPSLPNPCDAAG